MPVIGNRSRERLVHSMDEFSFLLLVPPLSGRLEQVTHSSYLEGKEGKQERKRQRLPLLPQWQMAHGQLVCRWWEEGETLSLRVDLSGTYLLGWTS